MNPGCSFLTSVNLDGSLNTWLVLCCFPGMCSNILNATVNSTKIKIHQLVESTDRMPETVLRFFFFYVKFSQ